jgi:hypothetical protein
LKRGTAAHWLARLEPRRLHRARRRGPRRHDVTVTLADERLGLRGRKKRICATWVPPRITSIRKLVSDDPRWYVSIEGSDGEMVLEKISELTDYRRFNDT